MLILQDTGQMKVAVPEDQEVQAVIFHPQQIILVEEVAAVIVARVLTTIPCRLPFPSH
jgi:hypothetical protein